MEVEADVWGVKARVPLFDRAPPDLIDLFITDLGASAELEADRVFDTVLKKVFKLVVG
jgi:translation initiation factor 2B subunit (eIF-2B alpha/beta/delta family)